MKSGFHFTVKLKLILGFGTLGVLILVMYYLLNSSQRKNSEILSENISVNYPSLMYTEKFKDLIEQTHSLVIRWTLQCDSASAAKRVNNEIDACHGMQLDSLKKQILNFVDHDLWGDAERDLFFVTSEKTDSLFMMHGEYMDNMMEAKSQDDTQAMAELRSDLLDGRIARMYKSVFFDASKLASSFYTISSRNLDRIDDNITHSLKVLLWCIVFVLFVVVFVGITTSYHMISSISYIKGIINKISRGILPEVNGYERNDEIGDMVESIKVLVANLKETSQFAIRIGEGDFTTEFKPRSKHDVLANSLLVMRDNLIKAEKDAEQRKNENAQRNWASQGLAEFNELLRNVGDDMQILSNKVIEKLVRYLDANMGGIYIVDDSDKEDIHLDLTAFYAYDRLKYAKQRIEIGENLIGQCFRENETVYLTDLPKGYVHISSGLGEADPTCLVIVPLKVNAETFGIVELASFRVIEKYQVEFIEKIGETIAATIANVKINMNTAKLLEESSEKSERLAQQEAEVHKNIENLKAKIENLQEINKNELVKYQKLHDDYENQAETSQSTIQKLTEKAEQSRQALRKMEFMLNNSAGYYELDAQGYFVTANNRFLANIELLVGDLEAKDIRSFMVEKEEVDKFNGIMEHLSQGLVHAQINHYKFNGKEFYLNEIYTPTRDDQNVLKSVMVISKDITDNIMHVKDLERQIAELKNENDFLKTKSREN
ncbi:MAG: GAF domain-containing protein [Bacteroidales bacterium]|nr:GAF domain-containing protein [Bacteroidales bacterium]MBR4216078.1 GAF domain-containing protein [Bacteroidales bacterium]